MSQAYSQWQIIDSTNNYKTGLAVIHPDTVLYTCENYGGQILKISSQIDTVFTPFTSEWYRDIEFPESGIGYVCGGTAFGLHTNAIAKSTDNGQTWDSLSANEFPGYSFNKLNFLNKDTGILAGEGIYIKTENGGQTFTQIYADTSSMFRLNKDISHAGSRFLVAHVRKISQSNPKYLSQILSSDDIGSNWNIVYSDTFTATQHSEYSGINDLFFLDDLNGYAVGNDGLYLRSTDGGLNWNKIQSTLSGNMTSICFTSLMDGYVCMDSMLYKTIDGGNTWHPQLLPYGMPVLQVEFYNQDIGLAMGYQALYRTSNAGDPVGLDILESSDLRLYPNPSNHLIHLEYPTDLKINRVRLSSINGQFIRSYSSDFDSMDVSRISSGQYILEIETSEGNVSRKVLIR